MTDSPKTRPTGRAVQPWTWWELLVIGLSALLIGFPLFSEALRWINPVRVPAQTSSSVPTTNDLRIGLAGNWGSAYFGDVVRLTVVATNDHPDAALSDVSIELTLPPSLELVGAEADRGSTPVTSGAAVTYGGFNLDAGDSSRLTVDVRVADSAQSGSVLVTQAQGSFSGADGDSFSNIVTVLVLGAAPTASPTSEATATAEPSATVAATATTEPSATVAATATAEPTATAEVSATAEPTATAEVSATAEPSATGVAGGPAGSSGSSVTAVSTSTAGGSRPTGAVSGSQTAATAAPATAADTAAAATAAPASGAPTGAAAGGVSGSTSNLAVPTALLSSTSAPTIAAVAAPANNVPAAAVNTPPAAATGTPSTRLPETSAGAPLLGFLLLGSMLITRTVRLHRARERI
jgi:hypothetical protein